MKTLGILLFSLFAFSGSLQLHDIHISKAEINFKTEERLVQISLHIFLDDLEDELELMGGDNLYLCTEKETENADEYLLKYINKNFSLHSKGQALELDFVGKEVSEDLIAVWCYFMIEDIELEQLDLDYRVMLSRFDDQKNIIAFKKNGKREGFYILDHKSSKQKLM